MVKANCVCCLNPYSKSEKHPEGKLFQCEYCDSLKLQVSENINNPKTYSKDYQKASDPGKAEKLYQIFRQIPMPENKNNRTLLDIGCNDGAFIEIARSNGWHVSGFDSDPAAVEIVNGKNIECFSGCLGSHLELTKSWHVITLWDVLEHVSDISAAMEWIMHSVKPGGIVVVLTPDADSIFDSIARIERFITGGRSQRIFNLCLNRYHIQRFSISGLRILFERHGFSTQDISRISLYSLGPEHYLSGFADGIPGLTHHDKINRSLSRLAYNTIQLLGIKNKILYIGKRKTLSKTNSAHSGGN